MPLTGTIAALVTVTLWGVNFAAVKFAISEVPPLAVSAMRFAILSILLSPFLHVRRDVFWRIVHYGLAMGIGHFTVLFIGMQSLDISTTGIVMQLGTPFVVMLAWLMLGEHFGIWRATGMGIAFCGIVVLIGVPTVGSIRIGYWCWSPLRSCGPTVRSAPSRSRTSILSLSSPGCRSS